MRSGGGPGRISAVGAQTRSAALGVSVTPRTRRKIVALLVGNAAFQYATQATRVVWYSYAASQAMPGILWINLTFVGSILCGIGSGILQGNAESGVRKAAPASSSADIQV